MLTILTTYFYVLIYNIIWNHFIFDISIAIVHCYSRYLLNVGHYQICFVLSSESWITKSHRIESLINELALVKIKIN
jgi:hypothetical protein